LNEEADVNRIVRERYPVDRLPDDLRQDLGLAITATVVISPEETTSRVRARSVAIAALLEHRKTLQPTPDDAVDRVRALRDEWD
jgi:hypothetical protein